MNKEMIKKVVETELSTCHCFGGTVEEIPMNSDLGLKMIENIVKKLIPTAVSQRSELLIATLYGWKQYEEQGISIEDYVKEIESNL